MIVLDLKNTNLFELNIINRGNLINSKFKNKEEYEKIMTSKNPSLFDDKFVENITEKLQANLLQEHKALLINSIFSEKSQMKVNSYALEFLNYYNFKEKHESNYSPVDYMNKALQPLLSLGYLNYLIDHIKDQTNVTKIHCNNQGIWIHKIDSQPEKLSYNLSFDDFMTIKNRLSIYIENSPTANQLELFDEDFFISLEHTANDFNLTFVVIQKKIHTKEVHFNNQEIGNNIIYSLIKSAIKANINIAYIGNNETVLSEIINFTVNQMNYYKPITFIEHYQKHCTKTVHSNKNIQLLNLQDNNISELFNRSKIQTEWLVWNELYVTDVGPINEYASFFNTVGVFEKLPTQSFNLIFEVKPTYDERMYQLTKVMEYIAETSEHRVILEFDAKNNKYIQLDRFSKKFANDMQKQIKIPVIIKHLFEIVEPVVKSVISTVPINKNEVNNTEDEFFIFTKSKTDIDCQLHSVIETVNEEIEEDFFEHFKK